MSTLKKLREEKRSNEEFEVMLKHLTLEEVFFARLELENNLYRTNLSGYKLYSILKQIISEGLIRFALDIRTTKAGASRFLGINIETLEMNMLKMKIPVKNRNKKNKESKNAI